MLFVSPLASCILLEQSEQRRQMKNETINRSNQTLLKPLENFYYAESWGIIRNVCLDVPFVVFQGCTAEKGCAGHSGGCWWQELLSGMEGIPTQGVASLSLLGICKVGTIEGTEKATREFVFKSGRTN